MLATIGARMVETEQKAILAQASVNNPVDATFLIKDADFGRNRRDVVVGDYNEIMSE